MRKQTIRADGGLELLTQRCGSDLCQARADGSEQSRAGKEHERETGNGQLRCETTTTMRKNEMRSTTTRSRAQKDERGKQLSHDRSPFLCFFFGQKIQDIDGQLKCCASVPLLQSGCPSVGGDWRVVSHFWFGIKIRYGIELKCVTALQARSRANVRCGKRALLYSAPVVYPVLHSFSAPKKKSVTGSDETPPNVST